MRVFAVRMGDFVEFRSAKHPPRVRFSKLTRTVTVLQERYQWTTNDYKTVPFTYPQTLQMVTHVGGRVLGTMRYTKYSRTKGMPKFGKKTVVEVEKGVKYDR